MLLRSLNKLQKKHKENKSYYVAHTHPLRHKRHVKWCATVSAPPSIKIMFIYQRREGLRRGRFGWGIGSAIKISCTSGLNDILVF